MPDAMLRAPSSRGGENLNPGPGGFHYRRYWAPTRYEARARAQADAARAAIGGWQPYAEYWDEATATLIVAYLPAAGRAPVRPPAPPVHQPRWQPPPPSPRGAHPVRNGLLATGAVFVVAIFVALAFRQPVADPISSGGTVGPGSTPRATTTAPTPAASVGLAEEPVPRFEAGRCRSPWVWADEAECGDLIVLEDRSNPAGRRIRLHVAIMRSWHPEPHADPIVYLEGGPGGSALADGVWSYPLNIDRDLIVFDQRGTGYSRPSLQCSEAILLLLARDESEVLRRCRQRLAGTGIELGHYTTAASAADVEDLRQVLGYEEWNLYGVSYGSRLALAVMRDYPAGVRSVILDSVYPMAADIYADGALNAQRAFDELFASCAANEECTRAFPDVEEHFYDVVERLDAAPRRAGGLFGLGAIDVDGGMFVRLLFERMYITDYLAGLPASIETFWTGDWSELDLWISELAGARPPASLASLTIGSYYSVQCAEAVPYADHSRLGTLDPGVRPAVSHAFDWQFMLDNCAAWDVPLADPGFNDAVASDIPALLVAGTLDPITPPAWAEWAAATLSAGQVLIVPGVGHGVVGAYPASWCIDGVVERFLRRPERLVSAACVGDLEPPDFVLP